MKYKVGDRIKIVGNSNDHQFQIGEIVTITYVGEDDYKAENDKDYWWVVEEDCVLASQYIVGVRHMGSTKDYYFEVPCELVDSLQLGDSVLCETANGTSYSTVTVLPFTGSGAMTMAKKHGASEPLKKIIRKVSVCRFGDIIVDKRHLSTPRTSKLAKRIDEYKDSGCFQTRIAVDENNHLVDGYSYYILGG